MIEDEDKRLPLSLAPPLALLDLKLDGSSVDAVDTDTNT
jgi:hypothetical protein